MDLNGSRFDGIHTCVNKLDVASQSDTPIVLPTDLLCLTANHLAEIIRRIEMQYSYFLYILALRALQSRMDCQVDKDHLFVLMIVTDMLRKRENKQFCIKQPAQLEARAGGRLTLIQTCLISVGQPKLSPCIIIMRRDGSSKEYSPSISLLYLTQQQKQTRDHMHKKNRISWKRITSLKLWTWDILYQLYRPICGTGKSKKLEQI